MIQVQGHHDGLVRQGRAEQCKRGVGEREARVDVVIVALQDAKPLFRLDSLGLERVGLL
jgi:hypothetical protein